LNPAWDDTLSKPLIPADLKKIENIIQPIVELLVDTENPLIVSGIFN
jgi:hypothetical protein